MSNPIPGWYPDPTVPGQQRYWDGTQWTENVAPLAPPAPPPGYAPPMPYEGYGMPAYGMPGYGMPGYGMPAAANPYAHWGLRVAASLLDALIVAPFNIAGQVVLATNTTTSVDAFGNTSTSSSNGAVVVAAVLYLIGLGITIWNSYVRQGRTGYSIGKQVVGIKLIKERTGAPLGGWPTFGRYLLHILDLLSLGLGYLWPLWDAKRQTFADKIVGSVVIVAPKPKN